MHEEDLHKYDDIIHLPRPVSGKHPRMSALNRAAQFSPFAALTGHNDAIRETERLTDAFAELDDNRKEQLDEKLRLLKEQLSEEPEIEAVYFRPDGRKSGGAYVTIRGRVQKIDINRSLIQFSDGNLIPIEHLYSVEFC